jgi:RNA polymerase sigma factor (sigma-70 family)
MVLNTTQWTVVVRAAQENRLSERPALGLLLEKYWRPLYFYARQRGLSAADAEDATQEFMRELIEGQILSAADPAKGRFRNFLLTIWKRFLIDRNRGETRLKRGGGEVITSIFCAAGEQDFLERSSYRPKNRQPEELFEEEWASSIVREAFTALESEYANSNRSKIFHGLAPFVTTPVNGETYATIASQHGMTIGAAKVALHRLRQRFADVLRQLVEETLDDPSDLEAEIHVLLKFISGVS